MGSIVFLLILIAVIVCAFLTWVVVAEIYPGFTLMPAPRVTSTPTATPLIISPVPTQATSASKTPSGAALAYVCSPDRSVHVVDTGSRKTIALIPFNVAPGVAMPSPDGRRLYVTHGANLSIIETGDHKTLNTLSFDRGLHRMAVTPDSSRIYVEIGGDPNSDIAVIDAASGSIIDTIKGVPMSWGEGMAFSPDGKYLYMTDYWNCELTVIDTGLNAVIRSIRCCEPGSYSYQEVFQGHKYWNAGTATDLAVSPDGNYVYVSVWSGSVLSIINARDMALEKTIPMPYRSSNGVVISPDGKYVYVMNNDVMDDQWQISNNAISIVSASNGAIVGKILISADTKNIRITPDGKYIYVCHGSGNVQVINTTTMSVEGDLGFAGSRVEMSA